MKKLLHFFIFIFLLTSVNAYSHDDESSRLGNFFDKVSSIFNDEKKVVRDLENAYDQLDNLNDLILDENYELIEQNRLIYLDAFSVIKSNLGQISEVEEELENILRLKRWFLEHELYSENDLFEYEVNELKNILELKLKNNEIKIKAIENQNDNVVKSIVKAKKQELGVAEVERFVLNKKVIAKLESLEGNENENVSVAKGMLSKVNSVEVEEGEEILEEVDKLSF